MFSPDLTAVLSSLTGNVTTVLSQMAIKKVDDMVRTSTILQDDASADFQEDDFLYCDEEKADEKHFQSSRTKSYHHFKADLAEEQPPLCTNFTRVHMKSNKENTDSMSADEYIGETRPSKTPASAIQALNTIWDFDTFENINEDDSMDEDEEGVEYGFDKEGCYRVPVKVGDIDADVLIDWEPLIGHRFVSRAAADTFLRSWTLKRGFKLVLRSSKPRARKRYYKAEKYQGEKDF
ncbi:hypothetical protein BGZ95_004744 [Linnemannia exigua]|uniref:Uncharacterized protein n=1 Tax=Linnemannia exigua TaxID=604196 RepID=A0AAD4D309_9FUNG|nr:hypothetical protein BGZ95_004744 [Linnemannia exigua]